MLNKENAKIVNNCKKFVKMNVELKRKLEESQKAMEEKDKIVNKLKRKVLKESRKRLEMIRIFLNLNDK